MIVSSILRGLNHIHYNEWVNLVDHVISAINTVSNTDRYARQYFRYKIIKRLP